ncbi:zeta toxin family protein [Rubellimicrobium roseum]|uniref:Toxin n=1 Tax=Rubellimicrobium roseum TaxID=687525 RepID=A0A5C4N632_9RHOB|nr:zeta toxin family protein [Rubellimicrobium roseum]TNC65780.1 toxin [Rubellimicrobium roseum]
MRLLDNAVDEVLRAQEETEKPLAIIVAGHNGSGKSTMWNKRLSNRLQIPLINADRMMLSILPEPNSQGALVEWAQTLRDTDESWMKVAQSGVQAFVGHAMVAQVPFAMETVFSHWRPRPDGTFESKIDDIRNLQEAGYFVLLLFVGLANAGLSVLRVQTRVAENGHDVPPDKLLQRFPRTQAAIRQASSVADATIFTDNSRGPKEAFTVCRVQLGTREVFDLRSGPDLPLAPGIAQWMEIVCPREQ